MSTALPTESRVLREAAQPVRDICGLLAPLTTADDFMGMNLAFLTAEGSARCHLHRDTVEIYYVLSGSGEVRINGIAYPINGGDRVIIRPGDCHQLIPYPDTGILRVIVAAAPAWRREDEILCAQHAPAT